MTSQGLTINDQQIAPLMSQLANSQAEAATARSKR